MDSLEQMLEDYRNKKRGLPSYEELVVIASITSGLSAAAIKWWEQCRPLAWNESQHLEGPAVNTQTKIAGELGEAVATYIKANLHKEASC